jgi:DNA-directed RNA polymerase III subunit RPC1
MNSELKKKIELGSNNEMIMENWEHLQLKCALYINGEMTGAGLPGQSQGKPLRGLAQRLKGKSGRFRGNLSGKRVDFSSRTVISPDPNLEIDQVAVPIDVCKVLTYPERVTPHNLAKLQVLVRNGPSKYPGANYVINEPVDDGMTATAGMSAAQDKKFLQYGNRNEVSVSPMSRALFVQPCHWKHHTPRVPAFIIQPSHGLPPLGCAAAHCKHHTPHVPPLLSA